MENNIKVDVKIELDDYIHSNKIHMDKNNKTFKYVHTACMVCIFYSVIIALNVIVGNGAAVPGFMYIAAPAIPLFYFIGLPMLSKSAARKAMESNRLLRNTQYYTFDSVGIEVSSVSGNAFIRWSDLYKTYEDKKMFALYISMQEAYVIPKRCFTNSNDIEELSRLISSKTKLEREVINQTFGREILKSLCRD